MMRWIVQTSLQYRFLVVVLAAGLLWLGIARLRTMPVDILPEFAPPYIEVQTEALGLSAAEVEQLISLNIEELLSGLSWVQTVRSRSVPGLSSVILTLEPGTNLMRARQLVQERLTLAHMLPNVSTPPVILQPLSATSRVMMIGMSSNTVSPIEMGVLAHWKIRPALMGVPGVANVAIWGQRERQLQVQVDPERLRAQKVTLDQVIQTAGNALWVSPLSFLNASTPGTGGFIDTPQQRLEVRHILPISSPADLAKVIVEGSKLRLGDVAKVVENHQPLIGDAVLGQDPGLLFVVEKFPGVNTLEVTRRVESVLAELKPGLEGIEVDSSVFRPASFIEVARDNLSRTLLLSGLLIVVVLFVFLYEWRGALIGAVVMLVSLLVALLVLYGRGATVNVMLLAGLMVALLILIDDAIVDVEHIVRRLRANQGRRNTAVVVLEAALEMRSSLGFVAAILVVAALPIFFLPGVSGLFFQPLALSYVLALLASMGVALTLTPALSLMLLAGAPLRGETALRRGLQRSYDGFLTRMLQAPTAVFVGAAVVLLLGLAALPLFKQQSLLPAFKERQLLVHWEGAPGSSHPAMTKMASKVAQELRALPGVSKVAGHVGRAVLADQVVGINSAQLWVSIDQGANYSQTVAAIQETIEGYPGLNQGVRSYIRESLSQALSGSSEAMVVRIFGPEFAVLRSKAEEVRQDLSRIKGIVDLRLESPVEQSAVEVKVDLAKAERYGLKPGDVRRAAATLMNGLEVGSLFENQKVFQVVVWSTPQNRNSLTAIREMLLDTPRGGHVRLEELADIRIAPALHTINREAISRRVEVGFNVRGRDLGAVAREVQERLRSTAFPLEYHAVVLGEYTERQAVQRIWIAGVVALLAMLFLLQAVLQSWRLAWLVLVSLPVALCGGVLVAFLVQGGVFTLGFLAGLLALLGIAVRNNVLLIAHYRHLEQTEGLTFSRELALRGAKERLVPTLMTAAAIALALLPFALTGSVAGLEVGQPMALVVLGGLVTTTLVNVWLMPALFLRFGVEPEPEMGLAPVAAGAAGGG